MRPQSPGPEGLAEQFAFKVSSGVFGRDISADLKAAGLATHFAYGSGWGALYGLLPLSRRIPPTVAGGLYGLAVWAVGPGWLVPAMKLMGKPTEEPPARTAFAIAGHIAYGVALAHAFCAAERSLRHDD